MKKARYIKRILAAVSLGFLGFSMACGALNSSNLADSQGEGSDDHIATPPAPIFREVIIQTQGLPDSGDDENEFRSDLWVGVDGVTLLADDGQSLFQSIFDMMDFTSVFEDGLPITSTLEKTIVDIASLYSSTYDISSYFLTYDLNNKRRGLFYYDSIVLNEDATNAAIANLAQLSGILEQFITRVPTEKSLSIEISLEDILSTIDISDINGGEVYIAAGIKSLSWLEIVKYLLENPHSNEESSEDLQDLLNTAALDTLNVAVTEGDEPHPSDFGQAQAEPSQHHGRPEEPGSSHSNGNGNGNGNGS